MSLLFMDGLDCYDSRADVNTSGKLGTVDTDASEAFSTTGGRFGGGCLQGVAQGGNIRYWQVFQTFALNTTYIFGASVKIGANTNSNRPIFVLLDSSQTLLFGIQETPGGGINVYNAANTVVATSAATGLVPANVWARIEFKFNLGTSNSTGSLEVRVNGATVITLTGQNFYHTGLAGAIVALYNGSATGATRSYDDITINDTNGDINNDYLGDVRIDTLKPAADTAINHWLPDTGTVCWSRIDDPNGASDGDTSFVQSSTVGDKSEFTLTHVVGQSSVIMGLQARVKAEKTDVGTRTYKAYLKSNGAIADAVEINPPVQTYTWAFNGLVEKNPDGVAPWTDLSVNNLKLGLELVS